MPKEIAFEVHSGYDGLVALTDTDFVPINDMHAAHVAHFGPDAVSDIEDNSYVVYTSVVDEHDPEDLIGWVARSFQMPREDFRDVTEETKGMKNVQ